MDSTFIKTFHDLLIFFISLFGLCQDRDRQRWNNDDDNNDFNDDNDNNALLPGVVQW